MRLSPFDPELIEVIVVDNRPSCVTYRKKLQRVKVISNLWRVDDGWWVKPVTRFYYTLELESGGMITVFRDQTSDRWYKQSWTT
jgi:hypothetical protein